MFFEWIVSHWIEIFGTLTGLLYIYLSIKENILLWPVGLISSVVYVYVFFVSKFYADMTLQLYYVGMSIYGWIYWRSGKKNSDLPVITTNRKDKYFLTGISILFWALIYVILKRFTDSPVPVGDAFTTALSITATWMLAKKYLEQWLVWIVVDTVSAGLYIYKGLYPTAVLYVVFTAMAFLGYAEWKKSMTNEQRT